MTDYPSTGEFGPPIGGIAPAFQCNRVLSGTFENPVHCGREGKWHIIWTVDMENGIACDEHTDEARRNWVFVGCHPYTTTCSIPGARWLPDEDVCVADDDDLGLVADVALAMTAPSGRNADPE